MDLHNVQIVYITELPIKIIKGFLKKYYLKTICKNLNLFLNKLKISMFESIKKKIDVPERMEVYQNIKALFVKINLKH